MRRRSSPATCPRSWTTNALTEADEAGWAEWGGGAYGRLEEIAGDGVW